MQSYKVENHWGGTSNNEWHDGGIWQMGYRNDQFLIAVNITSDDNGKTFKGSIQYQGEGPIDFRAKNSGGNNYTAEVHWGSDPSWHTEGTWVIGGRKDQRCISVEVKSDNNGKSLDGYNTYEGEGHIGFRGARL